MGSLCHVIFVVLITREAQKLIALYALGLLMLISPSVHIAHHLRTSSSKGLMQLLDAIAKIVAIALRVATAEDSHGLAIKVDTLDIIQQVVPCCAGAVLIGTCVPRRATHKQPVIASKIFCADFSHVHSLNTCFLCDNTCYCLSVARLCGVEEAY